MGSGRPVSSSSGLPTYQPEEEEADDTDSAEEGRANDVAEADGAHGDHEEVDALPVAHVVNLGKVGEVASVLQLISCRLVGGKVRKEESEWGYIICGQVRGYNRSRSDCTCNMINLMRFGSSCMGLNIEIMGNI